MAAPAFGPFRTAAAPVTSDARDPARRAQPQPSSDPFAFAFRAYQATLSSQDGPRCAHSPTCSLYGLHAVRRHRVLGFFLTTDRIWRQDRSSVLRPLPRDWRGEMVRHYDPLDANDFWLRGIDARHVPELVPSRGRQ